MYDEPDWQKALKWLGILLAIGAGIAYYFIANQPAAANPKAATPAPFTSIAPNNNVIILEAPTTDPLTLLPADHVREGNFALDFTLPTLEKSELISLSQFKGQPVVINFWASWCVPCRTETPALERAFRANQASNLIIIGVNTTAQDTIQNAKAFVEEFGVTYPIVLDEEDTVSQMYSVLGLPTSLFINREGRIQRIFIGGMTEDAIKQYIAEIVNV